jgi:hypothetical protein
VLPVALLNELVQESAQELVQLLGLRSCAFEAFPFDVQLPRIERRRIVLPAAEPGVEPWTCDRGVELPVRYRGLTVARFVLVPMLPSVGVVFSPEDRAAALRIAVDVGPFLAAGLVS